MPVALARELNALGYVSTTTKRAGRSGASDDNQLLYAAQRGILFVTHNGRDFALLHDAWQRWFPAWGVLPATASHQGIVILEQLPVGQLAGALNQLLSATPLLTNQLYRYKQGHWELLLLRGWVAYV